MEQTIENFEGTKVVENNYGGESMGDVQERAFSRCRGRNNISICVLCSVSMVKESN